MSLLRVAYTILYFFLITCSYSCSKIEVPDTSIEAMLNLPEEPYDYSKVVNKPGFPVELDLDLNIFTNRHLELGRVLFYDKRLSINNTTSCASCHKQQYAFADNTAFSNNFNDNNTLRNTPSLLNFMFKNDLMWDASIEKRPGTSIAIIVEHYQMGILEEDYLLERLMLLEYYKELFSRPGIGFINMYNIRNALQSFMFSMHAYNSKYDKAYENDFKNFSEIETAGLKLYFKAGCNGCHSLDVDQEFLLNIFDPSELFNNKDHNKTLRVKGENIANNGLALSYNDKGAGNDIFKIPDLRNVELTAPYMHDGRLKTIKEVIEFYSTAIQPHPFLDDRLTGKANFYESAVLPTDYNAPIRFNFSKVDKEALIAFLHTLTDTTLTTSPLYANPFKE